ncbi:MAG: hypothetical protein WCH99_12675, partial [Verrucomicrobiota bacterium]
LFTHSPFDHHFNCGHWGEFRGQKHIAQFVGNEVPSSGGQFLLHSSGKSAFSVSEPRKKSSTKPYSLKSAVYSKPATTF